MEETLTAFTPAVQAWFLDAFGVPTSPQAEAWPAIQRGEHTLILAPTGSGKTLAAFLWGIDSVLREKVSGDAGRRGESTDRGRAGVRLLYISPLKALNNDVERNLRAPLRGIRRSARTLGLELPRLRVAVRSGDTPPRERRAAIKDPPDILITTPESLYLLLTSAPARETLRSVRTVIVDEVHTLVGEKRGVHLSVSLERLERLTDRPPQRIGCSATIRPLPEAAHFLGGSDWGEDGTLVPRPVTIVDAGYRKPLDLRVETVVRDFRGLEGGSVWPTVIGRVAALIRRHHTTLVFANSRRLAERTADRLTEALAVTPGVPSEAGVGGSGVGIFAAGTGNRPSPIRAHHGSMSRESRLRMEADLKAGNLPALVGTSSLELGIDIGSVDLVVQLQSPKGVAQGLQRVGRSGHLVGQTSKGRIFATHVEDVMEAAVIAGGMRRGDVESTYTPRNCLDVLAQQVVAMVAVEDWGVEDLYRVVRRSYPYQDLTLPAFSAVLDMLSGRYPSEIHGSLRARLSWDRVNDRVHALPGARLLAVTNGGTIPNRGAFGAYLPDGKTRIGELDEEFVFETRVGDAFMLGSQVWRVLQITDDRMTVAEAPGSTPRMPFWHGDLPWRGYELGLSVGRFRREVAERLEALREAVGSPSVFAALESRDHHLARELETWLRQDYALDETSARHVMGYVAAQLDRAGTISSDRTVVVEVFDDALGDPRVVVQSPFGGRVHGPWALALAGMLRERLGREVEALAGDEGILLRIPDADSDLPLGAILGLSAAEARERVLRELPDSAVFGARFRQNAARALLLPGRGAGRRTPFWLQRLRAKDLLRAVRGFPEFPVVAETYRECLEDVMDLPHLEEVLEGLRSGALSAVTVESLVPSPVAEALLRDFVHSYMYEWDAPKAERNIQALSVSRELLQDILRDVALDGLLRPRALEEVLGREQRTAPGWRARTAEELAMVVEALGDLTPEEAEERAEGDAFSWLGLLEGAGRVAFVPKTGGREG
ncbi:MAG: DEAD/DEAH box helicase [Thermoleophilia bacterium]